MKLLVMTEERREELRRAGAYTEEVFYAMTEVDLDELVEGFWIRDPGPRRDSTNVLPSNLNYLKRFAADLLAHIKEGK